MKRLRFDEPSSHVLLEGGERIPGGSEFVVEDDRAIELLTSPHQRIVEARRAWAGTPARPPRPRAGQAPGDQNLTRRELDDLARERGISQPEKLANKAAVLAAINEPEANPGEGHQATDRRWS